MPFDRARTSLSAVEEKLRKLFGLAGEIGASFSPAITPVTIVNDLRDPGVAAFRGRRFAWSSDLFNVLASGVTGLKFGSAAVVERIRVFSVTAAGQRTEAYYFPVELEAASPSVTLATSCGTWIDQGERSTDICPLFTTSSPSLAGSSANFNDDRRIAVFQTGAEAPQWDYPMHFPGGSALYFNVAAVQGQVTVAGRIFG